jgi:ubiquinone/menaquinone biosynthesis C-methylase UbiE
MGCPRPLYFTPAFHRKNRLACPNPQAASTKAHFDRISGCWSRNYDLSGAMRRRIDDFSAVLKRHVAPEARVLDFGCGSGDITRALAREGFAMTGVDLSPAMIAAARQAPGAEGIEWLVVHAGDVTLPFSDCVFDGAQASSVFEYHADCAGQLQELHRVLKPGGVFSFTVPDMAHPSRRAEVTWRGLAQGWLWPLLRLTPRHDYFEYLRVSANRWPLEKWLALARDAGFSAEPPATREASLAMIVCRKRA